MSVKDIESLLVVTVCFTIERIAVQYIGKNVKEYRQLQRCFFACLRWLDLILAEKLG